MGETLGEIGRSQQLQIDHSRGSLFVQEHSSEIEVHNGVAVVETKVSGTGDDISLPRAAVVGELQSGVKPVSIRVGPNIDVFRQRILSPRSGSSQGKDSDHLGNNIAAHAGPAERQSPH